MKYKVVQWGTGNLGKLAVQSIIKHPDLELIGTWVSSSEKAGRDAGELCGVAPIGVQATRAPRRSSPETRTVSVMPPTAWAAKKRSSATVSACLPPARTS